MASLRGDTKADTEFGGGCGEGERGAEGSGGQGGWTEWGARPQGRGSGDGGVDQPGVDGTSCRPPLTVPVTALVLAGLAALTFTQGFGC